MLRGMLLGLSVVTMMGIGCKFERTYTREAQVINVDKAIVTVIDKNGNLWEFEGDGYDVNDNVKLIMDTNNTDEFIYDDYIKDVK